MSDHTDDEEEDQTRMSAPDRIARKKGESPEGCPSDVSRMRVHHQTPVTWAPLTRVLKKERFPKISHGLRDFRNGAPKRIWRCPPRRKRHSDPKTNSWMKQISESTLRTSGRSGSANVNDLRDPVPGSERRLG